MNNPRGLTALEALAVAIRAEKDAQIVYQDLADRMKDRVLRRRFELLVSVKAQHEKYLTEHYEEVAGGVPLKLPPSWLPDEMTSARQRAAWSLGDVLDLAIEGERTVREFYLKGARKTEDLSARAMYRFLADAAHRHWMVLAQEKDMLVRYPNYGRPGVSPWHSEKSVKTG